MTVQRCGAKKKDGTPCQQFPVHGRNRCRLHGGATPVGMQSPHFKDGRYSKHMKNMGIAQAINEAAHDPEILNLTELIAVYQVRIQKALEALGEGGGLSRWPDVKVAVDRMKLALGSDQAAFLEAFADLQRLVRAGNHDFHIWRDIDLAAINLKKLTESERKRRIEAKQLVPVVGVGNFARELILAVRAEVTDVDMLARIENRLYEKMQANVEMLTPHLEPGNEGN